MRLVKKSDFKNLYYRSKRNFLLLWNKLIELNPFRKHLVLCDAEEKPHAIGRGAKQFTLELNNGLSLSAVQGVGKHNGLYGNTEKGTYEIAFFNSDGDFVPISPFDDVMGHLEVYEVNKILKDAQTDNEFVSKLEKAREEMKLELEIN